MRKKRYLALVMSAVLVLQAMPMMVYAEEKAEIVQSGTMASEMGENLEDGEEAGSSEQKEEKREEKADSNMEPAQPEESTGEDAACPVEGDGQELPEGEEKKEQSEENAGQENSGEENDPAQGQPVEITDEEQTEKDAGKEDVPLESVSENMVGEEENDSDPISASYAVGDTGEYQPEGVEYRLKYAVVEDGVKITGITDTAEGELKIPETIDGLDVVEIGERAFYYCTELTGGLRIPESVTAIGESAFYYCTGFTGKLIIPDSVHIISDSAFQGCDGISEVRIHEKVERLGSQAFSYSGVVRQIYVFGRSLEIGQRGLGYHNIIYGYPGSTAEDYVKNDPWKNEFISLDEPIEIKEYYVKNSQELLNARGSFRRIILADGFYDLGESLLYIGSKMNLSIEAEHPGKVEILSQDKLSPVISIEYTKGFRISGCILGHDSAGHVGAYECGENGYVIQSSDSKDIEITDCDLYGCGIWGIVTARSSVVVENSVIRDCKEGITRGYQDEQVVLKNCIFSGNAYDESDEWEDRPALHSDNKLSAQDCVFLNNYNQNLMQEGSDVVVENCSFYNNVWDGGVPQTSGICLNGITWQMDGTVLKLGYPLELGGDTIESKTGMVLPYSDSSLPWKDCKFDEIVYAEGIFSNSRYITLQKAKTVYECGETLNLDDLIVTYHDEEVGTSLNVNTYATNVDQINMSEPGKKLLIVTYQLGSDIFTEEMTVTVTEKAVGDNIASGEYQNITWVIDSNGKLTVNGKGEFAAINTHQQDFGTRAPWHEYGNQIRSAEINVQDLSDASEMFSDCSNLVGIDLSRFDTSQITDVENMFYGCSSLKSLDLSHFDTGQVTDMSGMFRGCSSLRSLDLSRFDTSQVRYMWGMFFDCSSLKSLDLSHFDTSRVTDMGSMFNGCSSLKSLDLSHFDTSKVSDMSVMFSDCESLSNLNVNSFDTSRVSYMRHMFSGCRSLKSLDLSHFDTSQVTAMFCMFANCGSLVDLNLCGFETGKLTNVSAMFYECSSLSVLDLSSFDGSSMGDEEPDIFFGCNKLSTIFTPYNLAGSYQLPDGIWYQPDGTQITVFPTGCGSMMITKGRIPTVSSASLRAAIRKVNYVCGESVFISGLTVQYYDTDGSVKKVTDYTTNENEIDMSTPGSKTLVITYHGLTAEINLNVSAPLVESLTISSETLTLSAGETALLKAEITSNYTDLPPVNWTSSNESVSTVKEGLVTAVSAGECTITASAGGKSAVCHVTVTEKQAGVGDDDIASGSYKDVRWRIDADGKLIVEGSGDFANFNSTDRAPWFEKRDLIKSAEVHLTGVTNISYMFYDCSSLVSLDLSECNTEQVTAMDAMFFGCGSLTSLNLSNFDMKSTTLASDFFSGCSALSTIYAPYHLKVAVGLPTGYESDPLEAWYDEDGNVYTELPRNLERSMVLTKGQRPAVSEPYITLEKGKTSYFVGEKLNTDDLRVTYYNEAGIPSTAVGYTTNADEIDMETPGGKTLIVTYRDLRAEIGITVRERQADVTSGLTIAFRKEQDRECVYTGSAIRPEIWVTYNGRVLVEGANYTVKYSNNIKVGNANITVTGRGNFQAAKSERFKIVQADIAGAELAGTDQNGRLVVVSGSKFAPVIYCGGRKLTAKDYSVSGAVNVGNKIADNDSGKAVTLTGKGNYTGKKELTLRVVKKSDLIKFTVLLDKTKLNTLTYDGKEHYIHDIQHAIAVIGADGNTNMKRGIDYRIVYPADVTNVGMKKFSVVGMGLYTGTVRKSYKISPADAVGGTVRAEYEAGNIENIKLPYRNGGVTFNDQLKVTYTKDRTSLLLKEGKDYKVTYSRNKKAGSNAKFTISFCGNYKGIPKQTRMFTIEKAELNNATIVIADVVYKGKPGIYKSVPYAVESETGRLIHASNYKVSYYVDQDKNIEMKGGNKVSSGDTVYVKLEAKESGNYKSDTPIIKTYRVTEAVDLSKAKISFMDSMKGTETKTAEYTGRKITGQEIKVLVNGKPVDTDLVVTYANNIDKGKATVIITGTGKQGCKYAGCKKAFFNITAYRLR